MPALIFYGVEMWLLPGHKNILLFIPGHNLGPAVLFCSRMQRVSQERGQSCLFWNLKRSYLKMMGQINAYWGCCFSLSPSFCISKQKVSEPASSWCNIHYLPLKSQDSPPLTLRCCLGIFWEELRGRQVFPEASNMWFLCKHSKSSSWEWHWPRCSPTTYILEERAPRRHSQRTMPSQGREFIPFPGQPLAGRERELAVV